MSLAQKANVGRSRGIRIKTHAMTIALEAIAQAERQIEFERQRKDSVIKNARQDLSSCESRLAVLAAHIRELKHLAGELEAEPAA